MSWVICEKPTGKAILETYNQAVVDRLNTDKYEAIPIMEYLQNLNRSDDAHQLDGIT